MCGQAASEGFGDVGRRGSREWQWGVVAECLSPLPQFGAHPLSDEGARQPHVVHSVRPRGPPLTF